MPLVSYSSSIAPGACKLLKVLSRWIARHEDSFSVGQTKIKLPSPNDGKCFRALRVSIAELEGEDHETFLLDRNRPVGTSELPDR